MGNPILWWCEWWAGLSMVERAVVILIPFAIILAFIFISPAGAEVAAVQLIVPIDVVALVQAVCTGIAAIGGVFATIYSIRSSNRSKRAEEASTASSLVISKVKDTVDLVERNTNSLTTQIAAAARLAGMHEGEARGRAAGEDAARTLAEGQRQGTEAERASVAANAAGPITQPPIIPNQPAPLPVADDRTATASERTATASERVADTAERTAGR